MRLVDRCRFIDSRQLRLTVGRGRNERRFLDRLEHLADHEYLDNPKQQKQRWWAHGHRLPYVYALGIEGHKLLYPELHRKGAARTDWRVRNRRVKPLHMDHRLAVTETMLTIGLAVEPLQWTLAAWREGQDFHQATGLPHHLELAMPNGTVSVPLKPDAYVELAGGDQREHFFLEVDRGTEPLMRATWHRSAIYRKLAAYWQLYASRIALQRGIPSFRVLVVTTTDKRLENMRALARDMDAKQRGSGLFLFSTAARVSMDEPTAALTAPIWRSPVVDDEGRVLIAHLAAIS